MPITPYSQDSVVTSEQVACPRLLLVFSFVEGVVMKGNGNYGSTVLA